MDVIHDAWEMGDGVGVGMRTTRSKLAQCQTQLARWSQRKFGDAEKVLKQKTKQLKVLQ